MYDYFLWKTLKDSHYINNPVFSINEGNNTFKNKLPILKRPQFQGALGNILRNCTAYLEAVGQHTRIVLSDKVRDGPGFLRNTASVTAAVFMDTKMQSVEMSCKLTVLDSAVRLW
jgi:hypothetical protein